MFIISYSLTSSNITPSLCKVATLPQSSDPKHTPKLSTSFLHQPPLLISGWDDKCTPQTHEDKRPFLVRFWIRKTKITSESFALHSLLEGSSSHVDIVSWSEAGFICKVKVFLSVSQVRTTVVNSP